MSSSSAISSTLPIEMDPPLLQTLRDSWGVDSLDKLFDSVRQSAKEQADIAFALVQKKYKKPKAGGSDPSTASLERLRWFMLESEMSELVAATSKSLSVGDDCTLLGMRER
jgi:hypothetical protein